MKWIIWFILICIALFALGMVWELLNRIWFQVVKRKTSIGIELEYGQGAQEYLDVANEVIVRDTPIEIDTWLTRDEYLKIKQSVKKRRKN